MSTYWCELRVFRPYEKNEINYLRYVGSTREYVDTIGLERQHKEFLENHISPDGKNILICTEGLQIYKFVEEKIGSASKIIIKPTEWIIPINTDDMDKVELASRVKFESISVIRFLTRDKRDILYKLDTDGKHVHYIGEAKVDNFLTTKKHKLVYNEYEDEFERLKQKAFQIKSNRRHKGNL